MQDSTFLDIILIILYIYYIPYIYYITELYTHISEKWPENPGILTEINRRWMLVVGCDGCRPCCCRPRPYPEEACLNVLRRALTARGPKLRLACFQCSSMRWWDMVGLEIAGKKKVFFFSRKCHESPWVFFEGNSDF